MGPLVGRCGTNLDDEPATYLPTYLHSVGREVAVGFEQRPLSLGSIDHHLYVYVCMKVGMYVRMYVCMYVRMYVCIYVCMYVGMYVCMYVCR